MFVLQSESAEFSTNVYISIAKCNVIRDREEAVVPTYDFAKCSGKMSEIENNLS